MTGLWVDLGLMAAGCAIGYVYAPALFLWAAGFLHLIWRLQDDEYPRRR